MSEPTSIQCENYEFCKSERVPGMGSKYCMTCGSWFKICGFGWDKLTIVDSIDECILCMNMCKRKIMFPTNCGHSFCLPCSKKILYISEDRSCLSPVPYGCAPCPKGCENPVKGVQCHCIEYDSIQDQWKNANPTEFNTWNDAQNYSIDNSVYDYAYGSSSCPLCRKKYER